MSSFRRDLAEQNMWLAAEFDIRQEIFPLLERMGISVTREHLARIKTLGIDMADLNQIYSTVFAEEFRRAEEKLKENETKNENQFRPMVKIDNDRLFTRVMSSPVGLQLLSAVPKIIEPPELYENKDSSKQNSVCPLCNNSGFITNAFRGSDQQGIGRVETEPCPRCLKKL